MWVRAAIASGSSWHLGSHPNDALDAGNVMGGGIPALRVAPGRLWVDLSCDTLDVDIHGGATAGQGIFGKVDAVTCTVRLADPDGIYDPLWSGGPFQYGGHSRLVPGVPVEVFAEVVNPSDSSVQQFPIFTGTADSWGEDWVPHPWQREATLIASDPTKTWARYDKPEQPAVGAGETVQQRVARLVSYFGWSGTVEDPTPGASVRTLAATTLAQPGWELLNRTMDDELGAVYFTPSGDLRWINREASTNQPTPRITLGCATVQTGAHDILVDATPQKFDLQLRNDVWGARTGGTAQHALSQGSMDHFGPYPYQRTDLGLADDAQALTWAQFVVSLYAFPQIGVDNVTMLPAIDPASWTVWSTVLSWVLFTDVAHIAWAPPDLPDHVITGDFRVVGVQHTISRARWSVTWQTLALRALSLSGIVWTLGPHANDRLDAGMVMA